MYFFYNLILHLFSPLIFYIAYKHCYKHPQFRLPNCWQKRRALNRHLKSGGILFHAVSAGETRGAFPILKRLSKAYPDLPLTLTSGSLNGAEQVSLYQADFPFQSTMLPLDYPVYIKRFMQQIQPKVVVIMETELWLNLYHYCYKNNIKVLLINTRITEKSYKLYKYLSFGRYLFNYVHWIGVQSPSDKQKIKSLGVHENKLAVIGNLKSLSILESALSSTTGHETWEEWRNTSDFCWVAGSVHHDEIDPVLQAHLSFIQEKQASKQGATRLILVPRKPHEFEQVIEITAKFCLKHQLTYALYGESPKADEAIDILIIDQMGYLSQVYGIADAAFVGGSLAPYGGHNILEPAAFSIPIISGSYHYDQKAMYDIFLENNAIIICHDSQTLKNALLQTTHQDTVDELAKNVKLSIQTMQEEANTQFNHFQEKLEEAISLQSS